MCACGLCLAALDKGSYAPLVFWLYLGSCNPQYKNLVVFTRVSNYTSHWSCSSE